MASENAKLVAKDVIKAAKTNKRIVLGKIVENRGYAKSTIENPKRVVETDSYQEEIKPFAERLQREIDKIQLEMETRDITQVEYRHLSEVLDKLYKNYQLATGGATERFDLGLIEQANERLRELIENAKSS